MKIGEFAERYGVSRDTVRLYIKNGLLIPPTSGAQYNFTERECQDMELILRLKKMCFSLSKILEYFSILRVSTMVEPESIQDIVDFLDRKKSELEKKAEELKEICNEIDAEIYRTVNRKPSEKLKTGVPIRALSLLVCPYCGKPLQMKQASLDGKYIYQGTLFCECGYQIRVEDGIIKTGNLYTAPYDKPDLKRGLYRNVSESFVTYLQRCNDFALDKLQKINSEGKIIMEGHCNGYFFLYRYMKVLNPDNIYIITDKYPEMLEMYKRNIEHLGLSLDILYIADASVNFPLKKHCVDILMDFMGDNEHSLYHRKFYLSDVKSYLAKEAIVIGAVMGFHRGAKSIAAIKAKYPEGDGLGYCKDHWDDAYLKEGYIRESYLAGVLLNSTNQYSFECHRDGEELFMEYFIAYPASLK